MGLWNNIKQTAHKVARDVKNAAEAIEDFINDIADGVGNAIETIGIGINDGLTWAGKKIRLKPVTSWLGGIMKGIFSLAGEAIKGLVGIIAGAVGGTIKIIGGILTMQRSLITEGLWDIFSQVSGFVIVILGKLIALIQSIFYAQAFERPLTKDEKAKLKKIFKKTLNYYVVRIIDGHSGLYGISPRAFTLGNTIFMKTTSFPFDVLVHETTHIWQHQQKNVRYTADAITAQWFVPDAYNWKKEINERNKSAWNEFNKEAQAEFIEDTWIYGDLRDGNGSIVRSWNGAFFDADRTQLFGHFYRSGMDYTDIARDAVDILRKEWF